MTDIFLYLLKVNIVIFVLFTFYSLVLHSGSRYQLNRFILLTIPFIGLVIPKIRIGALEVPVSENLAPIGAFGEMPLATNPEGYIQHVTSAPDISLWILLLYLSGLGIFMILAIREVYLLMRIKQKSDCRREGPYLFIYTGRQVAFSFFNWIFLPATHCKISDKILKHEQVHARQVHSLDLLLMEVFRIVFWCNPVFFLMRKNLRENHEFIADRQVIRQGVDLVGYLEELVAEAEMRVVPGMATAFRSNSLKKRIKRMVAAKPSHVGGFRYVLLLIVLGGLLFSFSYPVIKEHDSFLKPIKSAEVTIGFGFEGQHPITKKAFKHNGIDYAIASGTDVVAAAEGAVVFADEKGNWGNLIIIRHADQLESYYAHLKDFKVKVGDRVNAGELIGHVGNTGWSTGPHLHFEIRKSGEPMDPHEYFKP